MERGTATWLFLTFLNFLGEFHKQECARDNKPRVNRRVVDSVWKVDKKLVHNIYSY